MSILKKEQRDKLSDKELKKLAKIEEVVEELITNFFPLSQMLLYIDDKTQSKVRENHRSALKEELINCSLKRLMSKNKNQEMAERNKEEIRTLITKPSQSAPLQDMLDAFYSINLKKIQDPLRQKLKDEIKNIDILLESARPLCNSIVKSSFPDTLVANKITADALRRVIISMEAIKEKLKGQAEKLAYESARPTPFDKRKEFITSQGIRLSIPKKNVVRAAGEMFTPVAKNIFNAVKNNNNLSLRSFMDISQRDKEQCLRLKKITAPVMSNGERLKEAINQLLKSLEEASDYDISTLSNPGLPLQSLLTELTLLTLDTPKAVLLKALETARTIARNILEQPTAEPLPLNETFSSYVNEATGTLTLAAAKLLDAVKLIEKGAYKSTVKTHLNQLNNQVNECLKLDHQLELATNVSLKPTHGWLDKVQLELHRNWEGLIKPLANMSSPFLAIRDTKKLSDSEKAHFHQIHLAVLPLLNETEKLRARCSKLKMPSEVGTANISEEKDNNTRLNNIKKARENIIALLKNHDIQLLHNGAQYSKEPVLLSTLLKRIMHEIVKAEKMLQDTSLLMSWTSDKKSVGILITKLGIRLEELKKYIKDVVEAATGTRIHNNSLQSMIAKHMGEWIATQKKAWEGQPSLISEEEQNAWFKEKINDISLIFTGEQDENPEMFQRRVELAIQDAQKGEIPWPASADEILCKTENPKQYSLAWAEKRLTYGILYNGLIYGALSPMLSIHKHSFTSPLRLINLLLTPIRMDSTIRQMEKVKPGEPKPTKKIMEYRYREFFKATFRLVSMLSPQLLKTIAAAGISAYGISEGEDYRKDFLKRAVARLPADLFWTAIFSAGIQAEKLISEDRNLDLAFLQEEIPPEILAELNTAPRKIGSIRYDGEDNKKLHKISKRALPSPEDNNNKKKLGEAEFYKVTKKNQFILSNLKNRVKTTEEDKAYSPDEYRKELLHEYINKTEIYTAKGKISYDEVDRITLKMGIDKDEDQGTIKINENYLVEKEKFKGLLRDTIQLVGSEDVNTPFHDYIKNLENKILDDESIYHQVDGKTYIKQPKAILYMYNTIINDLKKFDRDVYYGYYEERDILKFVRLKNTQVILKQRFEEGYDNSLVKEIIKIDDAEFHTPELSEPGMFRLLDYTLQPWFDKNSSLYKKILTGIQENYQSWDTTDVINFIYTSILDEINKTIDSPLPFVNDQSLTGQYLNRLTQVHRKLQSLFGNLYRYDHLNAIHSSSANRVKERIIKTYDRLKKYSSNSQNSLYIAKFCDVNNIPQKGLVNSGSDNSYINISEHGIEVLNKYKKMLKKEFDFYLKDLNSNSNIPVLTQTGSLNEAFIAESQHLLSESVKQYGISDDNLHLVITKYISGELTKKEFNSNKDAILNYFALVAIHNSLINVSSRDEFSLALLGKVYDVNFEKIIQVSEGELISSGQYREIRNESRDKYLKEGIVENEFFLKIAAKKPDNDEKTVLIHSLINIHDGNIFDEKNVISDSELLKRAELKLSLSFIKTPMRADENIESFTMRVIKKEIDSLELRKAELEKIVYRSGISKDQFQDKIRILRKVNLVLLHYRNEINERRTMFSYAEEIVSQLKFSRDKFTSDYLDVSEQRGSSKDIENAKIAAIKHLYKIDSSSPVKKTRLEYLNIYHAHVTDGTPDGYHLKHLASLYWAMFYYPPFSDSVVDIFPYLSKDADTGENKQFGSMADDKYKAFTVKALMSHASSSNFVKLFEYYENLYEENAALAEITASGENIPGTYFSITDIKRRHDIPHKDIKVYSDQFKKYTSENMDKDIKVLIGNRIRKCGVDVEQLSKKPKSVYTYKMLTRYQPRELFVRDRSQYKHQDTDLVIVVNQDNSIIVSALDSHGRQVYYFPPAVNQPDPESIPYIIKDIAPYSLDFKYNNKDDEKYMKKIAEGVGKSMSFYYHITPPDDWKDEIHYSFKDNKNQSQYIIMESNDFGIFDKNLPEVYSWDKKKLVILKRTSTEPSEKTVEEIFKDQARNFLKETIEVMREIYNDDEPTEAERLDASPSTEPDVVGSWLMRNLLPSISSVTEKAQYGLPVTDPEIVLSILETTDLLAFTEMPLGAAASSVLNKVRRNLAKISLKKGLTKEGVIAEFRNNVNRTLANTFKNNTLSQIVSSKTFINKAGYSFKPSVASQKLTGQGKFSFNNSHSTLDDYKRDPLGSFNKAVTFSDDFYYDILRKYIGKDILSKASIERKGTLASHIRYMNPAQVNRAYFDAMQVEQHMAQRVDYQIGIANYTHKVNESVVRFYPESTNRQLVLTAEQNRGQRILAHGENAARELEGTIYFPRVQIVLQGADSADIISNKVSNLFRQAHQQGNEQLLNSIKSDIRAMWPELSPAQVDDIITTTVHRNELVRETTSWMAQNNYDNIVYIADERSMAFAYVYANDRDRTIMANLASEAPSAHATILHEVSHFSGTQDFVYQADLIGTSQPIRTFIEELRAPANLLEFAQTIPEDQIRTLLNLDRNAPVTLGHQHAAYTIVHQPDFPVVLLKNNADTYVQIMDKLDMKYMENAQGQFIVNPHHLARRDISSGRNQSQIKARNEFLKLIYSYYKK